MADTVIDGRIGVDLTVVWASASAGAPVCPYNPGETVRASNGSIYMFARCASDTSQYDTVIFSSYGASASLTPTQQFVPITTTNAAATGYNAIGFCQNSVASSYSTWVCMTGQPRVNALIACNPKVPLYTTATAGKLDDTTVSAGYVVGVVLNTSATSASAPYAMAQWPHLITSNPV